MTTDELIAKLKEFDVRVSVRPDGMLEIDSPKGFNKPAVTNAIKHHKAKLIEKLGGVPPAPKPIAEIEQMEEVNKELAAIAGEDVCWLVEMFNRPDLEELGTVVRDGQEWPVANKVKSFLQWWGKAEKTEWLGGLRQFKMAFESPEGWKVSNYEWPGG